MFSPGMISISRTTLRALAQAPSSSLPSILIFSSISGIWKIFFVSSAFSKAKSELAKRIGMAMVKKNKFKINDSRAGKNLNFISSSPQN